MSLFISSGFSSKPYSHISCQVKMTLFFHLNTPDLLYLYYCLLEETKFRSRVESLLAQIVSVSSSSLLFQNLRYVIIFIVTVSLRKLYKSWVLLFYSHMVPDIPFCIYKQLVCNNAKTGSNYDKYSSSNFTLRAHHLASLSIFI